MDDADNLARLQVAVRTGLLPADLGQWALALIARVLPAERRRARNALLRQAAAISPERTTWAKARRLAADVLAVRRHADERQDDEVRAAVRRAVMLDGATPISARQIVDVLGAQHVPELEETA